MIRSFRMGGEGFLAWPLFARLTIAGKMLVGYAILVALTLTVVGYVLMSLYRINDLNRTVVTVDIPMIEAAERMNEALHAQNVYEKRFLILRRKDLRHLFWERAKEFDTQLMELKRLQTGSDLPVASLAKLHALYGDLFLELTKRVQAGKAKSAENLSNGKMAEVVEKINELLETVPPAVRATWDGRMKLIGETSRAAILTTIVLCFVSMAFGVLAGALVTSYISTSLRRIKTGVGHVAEGDFDYGLQMQAQDELGELARAFDVMGKRLKMLEEMYLDASPLTRLSGGIAIEREIERRIKMNEPMALCVMDIDNFKAFNDRYGYAHGNEVIRETAKLIESAARTHGAPEDFVGHIGGDDFVVVTNPDHMRQICGEIIERFDRKAPEYYEPRDRELGYILGKTRQGVDMQFPFVSISIAVITNLKRTFVSAVEMSEVAAELKDYAKTFPRSIYVIDQRRT